MERRKFLAGVGGSAVGGSAIIGSGAFTRIGSQRRAKIEVVKDPYAYLGLDSCPNSPNASYTSLDGQGHLQIDMSPDNPTNGDGQGINSDSFTYFDNLFQICNQGKQKVGVWIEAEDDPSLDPPPEKYQGDLPRVQFYNSDNPEHRVDSIEDAFRLKVGECKCIGMRVMTKGLEEGDQLLKKDQIVIHADADQTWQASPVDDSVNIAGSRDDLGPNDHSLFQAIDTSRAFWPEEQHVTVSGHVDIGDLKGNSSVFVGLIAQDRFHAWQASEYENTESSLFGFLETAYGGFNTQGGGRAGVGQRQSFGEVLSEYAGSGYGDEFEETDWEVTFGPTEIEMSINGDSASWSYDDHFDYLAWDDSGDGPGDADVDNHPVSTDWSNGAYPFVMAFADEGGSGYDIDVTFQSSALNP